MILYSVVYAASSSSSSTARRGSTTRSPPVWDGVPTQSCTVHKHREPARACPRTSSRRDQRRLHRHDLRGHAGGDRGASRAFLRKWRLRHPAVADSLEEAGDKLFTFTRLPRTQWERETTNAIERPARGVQATDQDADRSAFVGYCCDVILGAARLGQTTCGKSIVGRPRHEPIDQPIDLAAGPDNSTIWRSRHAEFHHIKRRHPISELAGIIAALRSRLPM